MKAVGVKELKNRLSEYLRMVRHGEDILVTDRGEVIAELRPAGRLPAVRANSVYEEMVRQGKIIPSKVPNSPSLYPRMKKLMEHDEIMRQLDESRGDH